MPRLSFDSFKVAETLMVNLLTAAALALLALVTAYWTWVWFAPDPEPRAPSATLADFGSTSAKRLFGNLDREQNGMASTGIAISLLGIVAASAGHSGYAVMRLEPKGILAVHEGDDISPGIRLAEVAIDHVILERNGTREMLKWPEKKSFLAAPIAQINK